MPTQDRSLEDYLKKLMELQYNSSSEQQFTEAELKDIALEAGLTERAWQESQEQARQHLQRGKAYSRNPQLRRCGSRTGAGRRPTSPRCRS